MEELHVQPGRPEAGQPGDPVPLVEAENELLSGVVDRVELVEAERERRGLLAGDEEDLALDVVGAPEVVTLPEGRGPGLPRLGPVLDDCLMLPVGLVDLDLDRRVSPLRGRVSGLHPERRHTGALPPARARKT